MELVEMKSNLKQGLKINHCLGCNNKFLFESVAKFCQNCRVKKFDKSNNQENKLNRYLK
jgi:hypothetical protein